MPENEEMEQSCWSQKLKLRAANVRLRAGKKSVFITEAERRGGDTQLRRVKSRRLRQGGSGDEEGKGGTWRDVEGRGGTWRDMEGRRGT